MKSLLPATILAILMLSKPAMAQPSPDRFFGYLDRNQDGVIDGDEAQRMPGPVRDAMQNARIDMSRGLSRDDFSRVLPRVMEEMRRRREEGGGYGGGPPGGGGRGPGGGPPGGNRGGDGRGPGDYGGRYDSRRSGGEPRSRTEPAKPKRWTATKRGRVTLDLDEAWKANDLNGDGQIGMYEWDRAKLSEFLRLDTNHDGLLTPREISFASDAAPAPTTQAVAASTVRAAPVRPAETAGGSLSPVEFDPDSSEGRMARFVFRGLDRNKDGVLDDKEWKASRSTRASFEKHGAQLRFPADYDKFAPWLVAVKRAEKRK